MPSIPDSSIHLIITSPPFFNAPHDYVGAFRTYDCYLDLLGSVAREGYRVLAPGRIFALNIDDMRVDGKLYPITADATKIFLDAGFDYRAKIVWAKPDGFGRAQRQSAVAYQHPYPMYCYFTNITESILVFSKGKFDYASASGEQRSGSRFSSEILHAWLSEWSLNVWHIKNVMPVRGRLEENVAAFPDELPNRLIRLYSYRGETVLDCFAGSGTVMKVARNLGRNSVGIEEKVELARIIRRKAFPDENPKDRFVVIPPGFNQLLVSHPRSAISCAPARNPGKLVRSGGYANLWSRLSGEGNQTGLRSRGGGR